MELSADPTYFYDLGVDKLSSCIIKKIQAAGGDSKAPYRKS